MITEQVLLEIHLGESVFIWLQYISKQSTSYVKDLRERQCCVIWNSVLDAADFLQSSYPSSPVLGDAFERFQPSWHMQRNESVLLDIRVLCKAMAIELRSCSIYTDGAKSSINCSSMF